MEDYVQTNQDLVEKSQDFFLTLRREIFTKSNLFSA